MTDIISDSRFHMWRCLVAISHADAVVTAEELGFIKKAMAAERLSDDQRAVLDHDLVHKQDIHALFSYVTDERDRSELFDHARTLVWSDGEFGEDEQELLIDLKRMYLQSVDFDNLEQTGGLSLDEDNNNNSNNSSAPSTTAKPPRQEALLSKVVGLFSQDKKRWS